jgi:hypothetical protein
MTTGHIKTAVERVFDSAARALTAAGYVVIPAAVYDAFCLAVEDLEQQATVAEYLLAGRMVVCADRWGATDAIYFCVGPDGKGPLAPSPRAAVDAHREQAIELLARGHR